VVSANYKKITCTLSPFLSSEPVSISRKWTHPHFRKRQRRLIEVLSTHPLPIHRDPDAGDSSYAGTIKAGELGFLISIEYLWNTVPVNGIFQGRNTKITDHGV